MSAAWPDTLPRYAKVGRSGGPQSNVVSFQPEIGPSIDRRRASLALRRYQVELPPMTQSERDVFVTFFEETLHDGVLPFTFWDPFSDGDRLFRFVPADPPYVETFVTGGLIAIRFELTRLA
jgi:hypothetical protein